MTTGPSAHCGAPPSTAVRCTGKRCESSVKKPVSNGGMNSPTSYATKSRANPCASSSAVWTISIRWRVRMIASAAAIPRACLRHGRISIAASPSPWMPPTIATRRCWPTSGTRTPAPGRSRPLGGKLRAFCRQRRLLGRLPLTRRLRAFVLSLYGYFSVRAAGFYPPHGRGPPALERSGAIVLRGNRQCLHIVPWIDLQFAEVA